MPLTIPRLDDRRYQDLVEELVRRIPAHTPEWTNPREGDPGRTMIELFAWLADTILYRANLIPERQRLAFLSLLGMPLRPALPARGLISLSIEDAESPSLRPLAEVPGPVPFETLGEVTVFPCAGECYYKRVLNPKERRDMERLLGGLRDLYNLDGQAEPYVTTRLFEKAAEDFDLVSQTIDQSLWIALIASKKTANARLRELLAGRLMNIGFSPTSELARTLEPVESRGRIPMIFEITHVQPGTGRVQFLPLDVVADSTNGLSQQGVIRLSLPDKAHISAPTNDVRKRLEAGVGEEPPRIDEAERSDRLVTWIRMRPEVSSSTIRIGWAGINAVEIDQRKTIRNRVIGVSDGSPNQRHFLGVTAIDPATLDLQIEGASGWRTWQRVEDLADANSDAPIYTLDPEAGTVLFGNGVRGQIVPNRRRIRVTFLRAGGGVAGNLPARTLDTINATDITGAKIRNTIKVLQPRPTQGGAAAETLAQAEQRLPGFLRHRERAVTELDYRQLAIETPGQSVGRVEILPMFVPQQRRSNVPGVVTVMAIPFKSGWHNPNPRAGRPFLEAIDAWLRPRKPLATELYIIGCEYIPLGISVSVTISDGFGLDETMNAIRDALRIELWPLPPGGPLRSGWPLGRSVRSSELEVSVARVPGVDSLAGLRIFTERNRQWVERTEIHLQPWQLPEVLAVSVRADGGTPSNLDSLPNPFSTGPTFGVPVVPETC